MEKDHVASGCRVLIIGGSAGSLDVLMKILPGINRPTTYTIVIVLHRKSGDDNMLEELLAVKTKVPVQEVEDKVALLPGYIYVAPSNYHLLFEKNNILSLDTSEKVNFSRPSIDVSFESAAEVFGSALIAVLLSGANNDGSEGLKTIKAAGGTIIVQDPATAEMPFMPANAIKTVTPHHILTIDEILKFITAIIQ